MIKKFIKSKKLFLTGISLALIFMVLDLYTKSYFFSLIDHYQIKNQTYRPVVEITSFFNLVQVWNRGVSFGMLNNLEYAKILIIILNLIILTILLIWLYRVEHRYLMVALCLIIGGALGNLSDRIVNHAVADFLDFHLFGYHWPAFNLADSLVFIGVCLLLLENFFIKDNDKKNEK